MKKNKIIILSGLLVIGFTLFIVGLQEDTTGAKPNSHDLIFNKQLKISGLTHQPIIITSNSEFTSENGVVQGDGSQNNPYIIANWTIDAGGTGSSISISGTSVYFIIKNTR